MNLSCSPQIPVHLLLILDSFQAFNLLHHSRVILLISVSAEFSQASLLISDLWYLKLSPSPSRIKLDPFRQSRLFNSYFLLWLFQSAIVLPTYSISLNFAPNFVETHLGSLHLQLARSISSLIFDQVFIIILIL